MVHYYLDLDVYSAGERPDPMTDPIVCITFCALDPATGDRLQEPVVLRAWQSSESQIVDEFCARLIGKNPFDFVPVGFNVAFDLWFLKERLLTTGGVDLGERFLVDRPYIDLKHVAVLANKGQFKGVRLGPAGNPVKDWYEYEDYASIERAALEKMERFFEAYHDWLARLA